MFRDTKVLARTSWAPGLVSLVLDLQPTFTPGQFFQLGLAGKDGTLVKRSYSAASAPGQSLEVLVSEVSGGALTPGLCALGPGDSVLVDDVPLGFFTLAEVPDCEVLWLLATGTGLGPFLSMLRAANNPDASLGRFGSLVIVHGASTVARLSYQEELHTLCKARGAQYVPCTTREDPPHGGLRGRITELLSQGQLEAHTGLRVDEKSHLLLCGNPNMIDDMVTLLGQRGLSKHRRRAPGHFNFEKYWS